MVRRTRPIGDTSLSVTAKSSSDLDMLIQQPFPLLLTKTRIPPLPVNLVSRPRLTRLIDQGMSYKLALIVAPVGFGKTTLLCEWCEKRARADIPCTWLSLDEHDNDPEHFLVYLLFALKNLQLTSDFQRLFLPPYLEPLSEQNLTLLINEITLAFPGEFVLVLDNYHVITSIKIHNALTFLLNHLPTRIHLLIASRTVPPFPLASLRAHRQLIELDSSELRFQKYEGTTFLRTIMHLELQDAHIAELEQRVEGWVVGLQLAAYAIQKLGNANHLVRSFSGNHSYIMDYLATEFFYQQSSLLQTILLQTSILDRMNASLCAAVTEMSDGQAVLDMLKQTQFFLEPLNEEHKWYHYYHLFKDFLYHQLSCVYPDSIADLHNRASIWFAQHGEYPEAIEHALTARNFLVAIDLISQIGQSLLNQCKVVQLLKWFIAIPDELILARPLLCFLYVWVLLFNGITCNVERYLLHITFPSDPDLITKEMKEWHWQALLAATQSYLANIQGDVQKAIETSRYALKYLPSMEQPMRAIAAMSTGSVLWLKGEEVASAPFFKQAYRESLVTGHLSLAITAAWILGKTYTLQGKFHKAMEVFQQALQKVALAQSPYDKEALPAEGMLLMGIGYIFRQWNNLEQATSYLVRGLELCKQWEAPGLAAIGVIDGIITLARIRTVQGQREATHEIILQAEQYALKYSVPFNVYIILKIFKKRLLLEKDPNLTQLIQTRVSRKSYLYEFDQLVETRFALQNGQYRQALDLLTPLLELARSAERISSVVEILMLQALAYTRLQQLDLAMCILSQAIAEGAEEHYMSLFVEEGDPLALLLAQTLDAQRKRLFPGMHPFPPDYALSILAACGHDTQIPVEENISEQLASPPELLSEREMEVLRFLTKGMLNKEVAEHMCLSESTVRWHIKNIYIKLQVHNRAQLICQVQKLKLC